MAYGANKPNTTSFVIDPLFPSLCKLWLKLLLQRDKTNEQAVH